VAVGAALATVWVGGPARAGNGLPAGAGCAPQWRIVPSPNSSELDDNTLLAVSASGPADAWAVGYLGGGSAGFLGTLTLHWDGTDWSVVDSPNVGAFFNALFSVTAIAPDDAWAVGAYAQDQRFRTRPLALHWDGATWSVVPVPIAAGMRGELAGVGAASSDRVWAVGYQASDPTVDNRTLVEAWNGKGWRIVPSPTPSTGVTRLAAVHAVDRGDAWAVGIQGPINEGRTLVLHWSKGAWSAVDSPNAGTGVNGLAAVDADAPGDVWAVGATQRGQLHSSGLSERWNGNRWRLYPVAKTSGDDALAGVAVLGPSDVWAVGRHTSPSGSQRPLVQHWTVDGWTLVDAERPPSPTAELTGVAADQGGDLWAVGSYQDQTTGLYRTLIERRCRP